MPVRRLSGIVVGNSDTVLSTFEMPKNSGGKRGKKGNSESGGGLKKHCTSCKKDGHTIEGFEIHGYPSWHRKGRKKEKGKR